MITLGHNNIDNNNRMISLTGGLGTIGRTGNILNGLQILSNVIQRATGWTHYVTQVLPHQLIFRMQY